MKTKDNIKHITHPLSVAEQNRLLHWLKENKDTLINNKGGNEEVDIEEIQELIEELLGSKEEIKSVTATVNNSTGIPFVEASLNEGVLQLAFHNIKGANGKDGAVGPQGPPGASAVFDPTTGNISMMSNTLGSSIVNPASQSLVTEYVTMEDTEISLPNPISYYINNNTWIGNASIQSSIIPMSSYIGRLIKIEPNTDWEYGMKVAFVASLPQPYSGNPPVDFCDGESEIQTTNILFKVVPSDCAYLVVRYNDKVNNTKTDVHPSKIAILKGIDTLNKRIDEVSLEKWSFYKNIDLTNAEQKFLQSSTNKWLGSRYDLSVLINVEHERGKMIKIAPNNDFDKGMEVAFLQTDDTSIPPVFCVSEQGVILTKSIIYKVIPNDCCAIYVRCTVRIGSTTEYTDVRPPLCEMYESISHQVETIKNSVVRNASDDINIQKAYTLSPFGQTSSLYAKDAAKRMMQDNVVPFILIVGQSNMDGRCPKSDAPSWLSTEDYNIPNYIIWNDTTKWMSTFNVDNNNGAGTTNGSTASSNNKWGPDAYFAHQYIQHYGTQLYALKHTIGATCIHKKPTGWMVNASWNPDVDDFPEGCLSLLKELVRKLKEVRDWAANNGKILFPIAILWHQGETDADNGDYQYYEEDLKNVIGFIRGCFGAQNIPFLSGYINEQFKERYSEINGILETLATEDEYYKVVDMSEHFTGIENDLVHYNTEAIEYMGEQMFANYLTLNKGI